MDHDQDRGDRNIKNDIIHMLKMFQQTIRSVDIIKNLEHDIINLYNMPLMIMPRKSIPKEGQSTTRKKQGS